MTRFIFTWYKLLIGMSAVLCSFAFLIFALKHNTTYASDPQLRSTPRIPQQEMAHVVVVGNTIYEVKKTNDSYDARINYEINAIRTVR